jgi:hypothetical protein
MLAAMSFDPYYDWLGIPPEEQPPHHYRLLGLSLYESNADAISNASDRLAAHLHSFQTGPRAGISQQLLYDIGQARLCLLDPQMKAGYDDRLRERLAAATAAKTDVAAGPEVPDSASEASPADDAGPASAPRVRKSPLVEFIKIAAGGMAGIVLAVLVLRYVFLMDITGLLPLPAAAPLAQTQQAPSAKPERTKPTEAAAAASAASTISTRPAEATPAPKSTSNTAAAAPTAKPDAPKSAAKASPRRLWVHSGGNFRLVRTGAWEEYLSNKNHTRLSFVETAVTEDYVEIVREPGVHVRIYSDHCDAKFVGDADFRLLYRGSWK